MFVVCQNIESKKLEISNHEDTNKHWNFSRSIVFIADIKQYSPWCYLPQCM